jgi:hypothetical protein
LHNIILESVPSSNLSTLINWCHFIRKSKFYLIWITHIDNIVKKVNQTLALLATKHHSEPLKSTTYKTFVRPQLNYSSSVRSPCTGTLIDQIYFVQRSAVRWDTYSVQPIFFKLLFYRLAKLTKWKLEKKSTVNFHCV